MSWSNGCVARNPARDAGTAADAGETSSGSGGGSADSCLSSCLSSWLPSSVRNGEGLVRVNSKMSGTPHIRVDGKTAGDTASPWHCTTRSTELADLILNSGVRGYLVCLIKDQMYSLKICRAKSNVLTLEYRLFLRTHLSYRKISRTHSTPVRSTKLLFVLTSDVLTLDRAKASVMHSL